MTFTTTLTADQVATKLRISDQAEAKRVYDTALGHLTEACVVTFRNIPEPVADDMLLRVAQAVNDGTRAPHGAAQLANMEAGQAVRAPRDPLAPVRPVLALYVVPL